MNVMIFTEIGGNIGFGHVVRCSVLYDLFKENGHDVTFILHGKVDLYNVVGDRNHLFIDWHNEELISKIEIKPNTLSIVDSYISTYEINELISELSKKTLFIDDNHRMIYPPGMILNPTIYGNQLREAFGDRKQYFAGEKYLLLRKSFFKLKRECISEKISTILITLGGSETTQLCRDIIETIDNIGSRYVIYIISSSDLIINTINDVKIYKNIDAEKVNELMQKSDLAISAGGQTLQELIKVGTPAIVYCLAENQRRNIDFLLGLNLIKEVKNFKNDLAQKIEECSDFNYRLNVFNSCRQLDFGSGVKELVEWLGDNIEI